MSYHPSYGVHFHQYADDTQLYTAVKSEGDSCSLQNFELCTCAVRDWFALNGMLLNREKSEVLLVTRKAIADVFEWFGCGDGGLQHHILNEAQEFGGYTRSDTIIRPACQGRREGEQLSHEGVAPHQTSFE